MKKTLLFACALYIAGCGSSDSVQGFNSNGANANNLTSISGRVVDENGAPLQGIAVKAQERTSGQELAIQSNPDGSFQITTPAGVYDLVLDRRGDSQVATSYYGPIVAGGGSSRDFVLHNRGGRASDVIFGKIERTPGSPAAGRLLNFNPGSAANYKDSVLPSSMATGTTLSDGRFEVALGHTDQVTLDLEIPDANGSLDEWVRVEKLDKPAYVEVSTEQSEVENQLRANENPPALAGSFSDGVKSEQDIRLDPFTLVLNADGGIGLSNGSLGMWGDPKGYTIPQLVSNPTNNYDTAFQRNIQPSTVTLAPSGAWSRLIGYEARINITNSIASNWTFTDSQSGKKYLIKVTKTPGSSGCNYGERSQDFSAIQVSPPK